MRDLDTSLNDATKAHGHLCPGQVLGVRMAVAGCRALGIAEPRGSERLVVYVEIDPSPRHPVTPSPRLLVSLSLCLLVILAGWWLLATSSSPAADEPLTVGAAASLRFAFTEIGRLFEAETGQPVVFSFGSTGNLAHQIENGAPMDVFAAANVAYVDDLRAKGLIVADSQQLYAQGRVVLAVNRANGVQAERLEDLLQPGITHVALANPEYAPYGLAAQQALQNAGLWEALQPKLVYGENVHQAMQFVRTGDAEAGLIALSVADVPALSYTLVDAGLHEPLDQAIAVVQGTPREAAARRFIAFVNGDQGQAILRHYGFLPPQ